MRLVFLTLFTLLASCSTSTGPDVVFLHSNDYHTAFDAAIQAAKTQGLQPALLNRRMGTISTEPAVAGSAVEPWKQRASSPLQAVENTLAYQRITARFEFKQAQNDVAGTTDDQTLLGPDLLAPSSADLTQYAGPMELRVWVYVDRYYNRGKRIGSSSLWSETSTLTLPSDQPWEQIHERFWVPISRDVAKERSLLAAIETVLHPQDSDISGN